MDRAKAGDLGAFGEIVRIHQAAAVRLATVIGGDPTEAHDIAQEAFVRAFHSLDSVHSADSLRAWLMRIVANQAKNSVRGRARWRRRNERFGERAELAAESAEQRAMLGAQHDELLSALARLADGDRQILACRYLAELSERETAEVLGIAPGTVKSRTSRALERLRAHYADKELR